MRHTRSILAIALALASACSGNDDSSPATETTRAATVDDVETTGGTISLTIDDTTYEAELASCQVEPGRQPEILATGQRDGIPIRIEYGQATANQLGVFINPANPLDPGDTSYIGPATFAIEDSVATANDLTLTDTQTGTTATASARLTCEP